MRTYDPDFQTELERDNPDVFHGVEIETGTETVRAAKRTGGAEYGGNEYVEAIVGVTPMASHANPATKDLDEQQVDVAISNLPGALPGSTRLSHRLPMTIEGQAARLDLYAYTEHNADGSPVLASLKRENLFVGTPHLDETGWSIDEATLRLEPLFKKHLGAPICDTIGDEYGFARVSDRGKAIPTVIGSVKGVVGRVTKSSAVSPPVPGAENIGTGILGRPRRGTAVISTARTWTVTIGSAETVEFSGPADSDSQSTSTKSSTVGAVASLDLRAESFQTTGNRTLTGVVLPLKLPSGFPAAVAEAIICTDNANKPSSTILGRAAVSVSNAAYADKTFAFSSPISITAATRYWIVLRVYPYGGQTRRVHWATLTTGGYANGKAMRGVGNDGGPYTWTDLNSGNQDNLFRLVLSATGAPSFTLTASPGGAQGSGTVGSDFASSNAEIAIPGDAWTGSPSAGDVFTFETDAGDAEVVFAESPSVTPCGALGNLQINGVPLGAGGSSISQTTDGGTNVSFGPGAEGAIGQSFPISVPTLVRAVSVKMNRASTIPDAPVVLSIRRAGAGVDGFPDGEVLGTVSIPAATFATTGTAVTFLLDEPIVLESGTYWLIAETAATNTAFGWYWTSAAGFAGRAARVDATTSAWTYYASTTDLYFEIVAAAITLSASAADVSGRMVARARLPAIDIPDSWGISADVVGCQDDSEGTYTGAASQLITIPADVMHYLARRAGLPVENIDLSEGESFSQSRGAAGNVQRFNGAFDAAGQTTLNGMLDWAFQAHSILDWSGDKLEYRYLSLDPEPLVTLGWGDVLDENGEPEGPRRPAIKGFRTKADDWLINRITLRYDRDWAKTKGAAAYRRSESDHDDDSITAYGERSKDELFLCDAITTEAMALDTLSYWLAARAFQKQEVEVVHPLWWARLEKGDVVQFDLPEDDEGAL